MILIPKSRTRVIKSGLHLGNAGSIVSPSRTWVTVLVRIVRSSATAVAGTVSSGRLIARIESNNFMLRRVPSSL